MNCPVCNGSGHIKVVSVTKDRSTGIMDTPRPCPMGCKPAEPGDGVAGGMALSGRERNFDRKVKRKSKRPEGDYWGKPIDTLDIMKHYGGKE